jgi:tetratricopeptide (TPR) repeat protein
VWDNLESLLANELAIEPVLQLARTLMESDPKTRLLFTTREPLPAPFDQTHRELTLGALGLVEAQALVMRFMANEGLALKHDDQGRTPAEIQALVEVVHGHARALVLLARELSHQGVTGTTENLRRIMQQLEKAHPKQRELSLFASVELSLQRLSAETRELVQGLAVLQDGGDRVLISEVLAVDGETANRLGSELIQVGLAEMQAYSYLRLDPALPTYLGLQLTEQAQQLYRERWSATLGQLVDFLYGQLANDARLAFRLTQLELPNLMAYTHDLAQRMQAGQVPAETLAGCAGSLEQLLAPLDRPQALAELVSLRQRAAERLGEWSHTRFEHERLGIERLLDQGDLQAAFEAAQRLFAQCEQAGSQAYGVADYDLAGAKWQLGWVLRLGGAAAQALPWLQQAQQGFEALGDGGAGMASVTLTEQRDCLAALGRLDEAATVYEDAIERSEKLKDTRQVAVAKGQLASVRLDQKDYDAALHGYREALALFQQLDEPGSVGTIWHQIGIANREQGRFEAAESAYREALAIKTRRGDHTGEASSLSELGNLYRDWNRPEQAVDYFRQTADRFARLGDQLNEGGVRGNLAQVLIWLGRLDEARPELERAIEYKESFGHASLPWQTWAILHHLEQADGNPQAARAARWYALQAYLAYRRDGGENHSKAGRLCFYARQAVEQGDTRDIAQVIEQLLERENWQAHRTFLHSLLAILAGDRNPALAEDESMTYDMAAELQLLIEP